MAGNPVDYAEMTLGVHSVYETAQQAADEYERASERLAAYRITKSEAEQNLVDIEADLLRDVWTNHPDTSQAARDRLLKAALSESEEARALRKQIADSTEMISMEEGRRTAARIRAEIYTARMNELGGYLHYLAEAKRAATKTA